MKCTSQSLKEVKEKVQKCREWVTSILTTNDVLIAPILWLFSQWFQQLIIVLTIYGLNAVHDIVNEFMIVTDIVPTWAYVNLHFYTKIKEETILVNKVSNMAMHLTIWFLIVHDCQHNTFRKHQYQMMTTRATYYNKTASATTTFGGGVGGVG